MSDNAKLIIERFAAWVKSHGLSQVAAAKLVSVSPATLSQTLSGTYAGDVERVADKMARAMDADRRRADAPKPLPFAATSVVEEVLSALRLAHDEGAITVVMGPSGVGKSVSCEMFCRAEPETIRFSLSAVGRNDAHHTARPVLNRLAEGLRSPLPVNTAAPDCIEFLAERLAGSGRLIIIDEADYGNEHVYQTMRMIHDRAKMGIAFVGTPAFLTRLRRKNSATIAQFLNRVAYRTMLGGLTDDDIDALLAPFRLDARALAAARAGAHGIARRLNYAMIAAQRIARDNAHAAGQPGKLDAETIAKAYSQLMDA